MSQLEKLVGAKALIESAIEDELAKTDPPPATPAPASAEATQCKHPNREEITAAGAKVGVHRWACLDCGHKWEAD